MRNERDFIKRIQNRVANTSIGISTLRNQGDPDVIPITRKFLSDELNLVELKDMTKEKFNDWLNTNTRNLKGEFPIAKTNWGAARKGINVFLESAFYNRLLAKEFGLYDLKTFLEVPLDSNVAKGLKKNSKELNIRCDLPKWPGIKYLTPKQSKIFQNCATRVAAKMGLSRIYLDLLYWPKWDSKNEFLLPAQGEVKVGKKR